MHSSQLLQPCANLLPYFSARARSCSCSPPPPPPSASSRTSAATSTHLKGFCPHRLQTPSPVSLENTAPVYVHLSACPSPAANSVASASAGRPCPPPPSKSQTPSATWRAAAMHMQRAVGAIGYQFHLPFALDRLSHPRAPTMYAQPLRPPLFPASPCCPRSGHRLLLPHPPELLACMQRFPVPRPPRRRYHRPHVCVGQDRCSGH